MSQIRSWKHQQLTAGVPRASSKAKEGRSEHQDSSGFIALLKICAKHNDLRTGTRLHEDILKSGLLEQNCYVASNLVNMYAKCGALSKAAGVLEKLPVRDVVSWSALIAGYAQQGQGDEALKCFECMHSEGLSPDAITFTCILKACGKTGSVEKGELIHKEIAKLGLLQKDVLLGTTLIDMYVKCGALVKAAGVLDELSERDVVAWNALIAGHAQHGQNEEAINCFKLMQHEGLHPNTVTFTCVVKACSITGAAHEGEKICDETVKQGLIFKDGTLGNTVVDMYAKCGAFGKAVHVLNQLPIRDVISWSVLIAGHVQQGQAEEAFTCFERMQGEGLSPNTVTFIALLKACGTIVMVSKVERIHSEIIHQGLLGKDILLGSTLVDAYVKCGALKKAARVLNELPVRDIVSWSALIAGYSQQSQGQEALRCFERMKRDGICPDAVTYTCILKACSSIGAADKGKQIHDEIIRQGLLEKDIVLGNSLVDMYAKCGVLAKAMQVLEELPKSDVVSWNTLITGYVQQGQGQEAVECFEKMWCEGLFPDNTTLACLLCACSRSGLLDMAQAYFVSMSTKYGVTPCIEHHTCMVDLFSRAGEFEKALAIIKKMPSSDHLPVWHALLGACQECGNMKLGKLAFGNAVHMYEMGAAAHFCGTTS